MGNRSSAPSTVSASSSVTITTPSQLVVPPAPVINVDAPRLNLQQVYNPVNAPVFNLNSKGFDQELSEDMKIILRVLFSAGTSAAVAYILDMNPMFYGAVGGVLSELRLKYSLTHGMAIGGATGISYLAKYDNPDKSATAIGLGCLTSELMTTVPVDPLF